MPKAIFHVHTLLASLGILEIIDPQRLNINILSRPDTAEVSHRSLCGFSEIVLTWDMAVEIWVF